MKKTIKENIRVTVSPDLPFYPISDDEEIQKCKGIIEQIKRHVDDFDYVGIEYDTRHICEFCDSKWEVCEDDNDPDSLKGEPMCCVKAGEEFFRKDNVQ